MVLAPVLVPFLFGSAWEPAVRPTQVLAVAGMVAAVLTGYSQVMLAIGRPRPLLLFNIGRLGLYGGAVLLASRHGLMTVAFAVVGAYVIILIGAYRLLPELGPALVGCLVLVAVTLPMAHALEGLLPRPLVIAIVGSSGLAVYALVLRLCFHAAWTDVRMLVSRVLGPLASFRRRAAAAAPEQAELAEELEAAGGLDVPETVDAAETIHTAKVVV
jgi:O-antigen/teichoic acid export membrane protein